MLSAIKVQTISAITTASGKAPPAKGIAAPRLKATAEAGAMVVMDWKRTPGRPMAFARSFVCSGWVEGSTDIGFLLLFLELVEKVTGTPLCELLNKLFLCTLSLMIRIYGEKAREIGNE
jgi:hypothetical protein